MQKFYYSFGSDPQFPFQNGWIIIEAPDIRTAHEIFIKHFPCRRDNILNCSFYYTEKQWAAMDVEHTWHGYQCYGIYTG